MRYTAEGTTFFGREAELAALDAWWSSDSRLLSLVGTGGVGKTTLAWQVVEAIDDAVFCDLSGARTAEQATLALRAALGTSGDVVAALQARDSVVVLDNLEQLGDAASTCVSAWLRGSTRLVCTSRRRLGLDDEQIIEVGPLPEADAEQLFVERAARGRRVKPPPPDALARLVSALDGLPLAIELAAGRALLLGIDELLRRVESSHELRRRGQQGQRHGSLEAMIRWTYDDLEPSVQRAFRSLGAFEHSFDRSAAEAVIGPGVDEALEELVDLHLVVLEQGPRFRLLRPLRTFARERLDEAGETARAHATHAAWYTRESQLEAMGKDVMPDLVELDAIIDRGLAEGTADGRRRALRAEVVGGDARLHRGWVEGRLPRLTELLETTDPEPKWKAWSHAVRAALHFGRGALAEAEADYRRAIAGFTAIGDLDHQVSAELNLVHTLNRQGRLDEALDVVQRAIEQLSARGGSRRRLALAWRSAATVHHARGDLDAAIAAQRELVALCSPEWPSLFMLAHGNLGFLLQSTGATADAIAAYDQALAGEAEENLHASRLMFYRATAHQEAGNEEPAQRDYQRAIDLAEQSASWPWVGEWCHAIAAFEARRGNELEAARWRLKAEGAWAKRRHPRADTLETLYLAASGDADARAAVLELDTPESASEYAFPLRLIAADTAAPEIEVGPEGRWFRFEGQVVSLARRANLRRIFDALVERHQRAPGTSVARDDVFDIGWPGETIAPDSAAHRVRVAVHTLRKLGLSDVLMRQDDGWLLLPELRVVRSTDTKPPTGS